MGCNQYRWPVSQAHSSQCTKRSKKDLEHGRKTLIIGIENRFGYQYLAGKPEHSGIRYGSVLPTKLINLYSKRVLHKEYRTLIYSRDGYKKLLLEAGYKNI